MASGGLISKTVAPVVGMLVLFVLGSVIGGMLGVFVPRDGQLRSPIWWVVIGLPTAGALFVALAVSLMVLGLLSPDSFLHKFAAWHRDLTSTLVNGWIDVVSTTTKGIVAVFAPFLPGLL